PPGLVVLADTERLVAAGGMVAAAPHPDALVVTVSDVANRAKLTSTPVLAVEVLSRSDSHRLERAERPRIEAKREDYAANGLRHYIEATVTPERTVRLGRGEPAFLPALVPAT
ncbi:MAG: Uma2 family endonuclease, partial [Acidimicrobiales bacterium]